MTVPNFGTVQNYILLFFFREISLFFSRDKQQNKGFLSLRQSEVCSNRYDV